MRENQKAPGLTGRTSGEYAPEGGLSSSYGGASGDPMSRVQGIVGTDAGPLMPYTTSMGFSSAVDGSRQAQVRSQFLPSLSSLSGVFCLCH